MKSFHFQRFSLLLCYLVLVSTVNGSESVPPAVLGFLNEHCTVCHEGDSADGGLDLTTFQRNAGSEASLDRWVRIFDRVHHQEMPPADSNTVSSKERTEFLKTTESWLRQRQQTAWKREGRVRGRRLTNYQLERTLHDLLGVDIPLAERMPDEPDNNVFKTIADGQAMSHFQLEQHLRIVDLALDEAIRRAIQGDNVWTKTLDAQKISRRNPRRRTREPEVIDGHAVTWSSRLIFYGRLPATTAREDGWYRFTVRAKGLNLPEDYGVWCTVRRGKCVSSAPLLPWVGSFEATKETQEWTFETWLPRGEMIEIRPGDDTLKMARFAGGQVGTGEGTPQNVPGVAIEQIVMERFHQGPSSDEVRRILFDDLPVKTDAKKRGGWVVSKNRKADIERLMRRFATRAFRRPVEDAAILPYVQMAQQSLDDGNSMVSALRTGYRALLCSPRFLYLQETPGQLDSYAIASRLSYFLWNSMPDDELLQLAEADRLQDETVIRQQVERMLTSPKGQQFVEDFASQWLDLDEIDFTTPDRRLYPGFDVIVQESMVAETLTFLQTMLEKNQSVTRIIAADESYLNERLARYYGIDGVSGDDMQPVNFQTQDHHRGGLLTQGAIMKITANGTNTSPVIRGVWVSERLLGREIPPPPASVPAIEPDIRGAKTIREMLEKHKSDPSCAGCHVHIDPPGFALENFDPSGRWRDRYTVLKGRKRSKGPKIDPGYVRPDGQKFESLAEYQKLLLEDPEQIAANVAGQLLTYGTGAPVEFADRPAIKQAVEETASDDYGFRSLVKAVATSPSFLSK
ncbi:DUF1592 domain-containing protein [Thalassoroseus pseudoceratinae]|uniref:DUF1592 domain-containing protein n=1 Tax=Thalassoroseus pseudoceratinae TaxID=2713176 RepID=UPI00197E62BC|nr:DUF1592 domain-containing protein [Thalassoroseus pseudoceratinae]